MRATAFVWCGNYLIHLQRCRAPRRTQFISRATGSGRLRIAPPAAPNPVSLWGPEPVSAAVLASPTGSLRDRTVLRTAVMVCAAPDFLFAQWAGGAGRWPSYGVVAEGWPQPRQADEVLRRVLALDSGLARWCSLSVGGVPPGRGAGFSFC